MMGNTKAETERKLIWTKKLEGQTQEFVHTILNVSHHGLAGEVADELSETIRSELVSIGVGKNSYGHPSSQVVKRLEKFK